MNSLLFQHTILPIRHKLYRFALRITGQPHDAEDVVQEVMEKIWKTPEAQSEQVQNWEAWCMTLTRNRSIDKNKTLQARRFDSLDGLADVQETHANPALTLEYQDMAQLIRQYIQQLPEKQRLVIHLRDVEDLSYEEIAKTLDISIDQVKINLHRARKAIRTKML
jgi:RNA polymerase sigma-70 factor (ECF subfamily)